MNEPQSGMEPANPNPSIIPPASGNDWRSLEGVFDLEFHRQVDEAGRNIREAEREAARREPSPESAEAMFVLRLDPRKLINPDLDIRYELPDLIVSRSEGILCDAGYDYAGAGKYLLLFLRALAFDRGLLCVIDVLEHEQVLENELLPAVVVATESEGGYEVVYPRDFKASFLE